MGLLGAYGVPGEITRMCFLHSGQGIAVQGDDLPVSTLALLFEPKPHLHGLTMTLGSRKLSDETLTSESVVLDDESRH